MDDDKVLNPYKPGAGLSPPHFAGRQRQSLAIEKALDAIKDGAGRMDHPPDRAMVLTGPRGIGKTVLVWRAIEAAEKRGIRMTEIDQELVRGQGEEYFSRILWNFMPGLKGSKAKLRKVLPAFLSKEPLLLIMDEAHRGRQEEMEFLFEVIHDCLSKQLPLVAILAGTPGLYPLLHRCKGGHAKRINFLRFNMLSPDEAKDALTIPAQETGRPMESGALKLLLDSADSYPFFIQQAGRNAWDASEERDGKKISVKDAKAGLDQLKDERYHFFDWRTREFMNREITEQAFQVAKAMREHEGMLGIDDLEKRLMEMNEGMDSDKATDVVEQLQELGFIWDTPDGLEPGIPSLLDHMIRRYALLFEDRKN